MATKSKWYLAAAAGIILVATVVRFYHFAARAPFDWDQNRDYSAVASLAAGKPTLIGPVARGDGGFHLGPLYYYLLLPGFILSHGNPASFVVTAMSIDLIALVAILWLLRPLAGSVVTLAVAGIWAVSPFTVDWARVSWNVALLPLWTVLTLVAWSKLRQGSKWAFVALGAMFGVSWHIHASLVPLVPLLALTAIVRWPRDWKMYVFAAAAAFLVYSPLFFFDLRHVWFNSRLMFTTWTAGQIVHTPWATAINDVVGKLGKNTLGLLTGNFRMSIPVGGAVLLASLCAFLLPAMYQGAALIIIGNVILAVLLRDTGFPEYYLAAAYIPTLLIMFGLVRRFFGSWITGVVAILVTIYLAVHLSWSPLPFGLAVKQELASRLTPQSPFSLQFDLPPGREGGIIPLLSVQHVVIDNSASFAVLVTDKQDGPLYIHGELAHDIVRVGGFRAAGVTGVK